MKDKTTGELLKVLHSTHSSKALQEYRTQHTIPDSSLSFADAFSELLDAHHLSKAEVIRNSLLDRTYAYQIINGTKTPGRDKILSLSIAAGLSLKETQHVLTCAAEGILYSRSSRDAIIIYCIEHRFDIYDTNEMLQNAGEHLLL